MAIELVPATAELLRAYYGEREIPTTYAFVGVENGVPVGVAGLVRLPGGRAFLYSDSPRDLHKEHAKIVMKVTRLLLALADKRGWNVVAEAEEGTEAAQRFLEHFDFHKTTDGEWLRWAR